jgi:hypothetical protein
LQLSVLTLIVLLVLMIKAFISLLIDTYPIGPLCMVAPAVTAPILIILKVNFDPKKLNTV